MSIDHDERTNASAGDPLEHLDEYERPAELRRARRLTSPLTWVLVCAVVAAGTFAIGAKVGNDHATDAATASTAAGAGAATRGGFAAAGTASGGRSGTSTAGAAGGGPGATVGQIQLVDGTNLYVSTFNGGVVKVTTNPSTTVMVLQSGKLAGLKAGSTVVVQGNPGAGGAVAATSISQTGARTASANSGG